MSENDIVDARHVARMLKVSYRTIVRLAEQGSIPGFRVGSQWRFRLSDIEAYINRQVQRKKEDE